MWILVKMTLENMWILVKMMVAASTLLPPEAPPWAAKVRNAENYLVHLPHLETSTRLTDRIAHKKSTGNGFAFLVQNMQAASLSQSEHTTGPRVEINLLRQKYCFIQYFRILCAWSFLLGPMSPRKARLLISEIMRGWPLKIWVEPELWTPLLSAILIFQIFIFIIIFEGLKDSFGLNILL